MLMGDSLYANPMMLGYAWQKGWIPLEKASIAAGDGTQRRGRAAKPDRF
jgi:Pyruvate/2-oxoacid:ferredoxin oxidoreductase gamma subunit